MNELFMSQCRDSIDEIISVMYNQGWNDALEAVFNKLHASYFVDGKPALVIHEDNSQRPAMPDIFELLNTLKK